MDVLKVSGDPDQVMADLRAWLAAPVEECPDLVVETSGSTGQPKQVRLSRAAVLASVRASADRLGATGPWVLALSPTFIAGVQVIARSLVAGHDPRLLERDGWPGGEGWFVSLVPTQLRRMLDSPEDLAALRRAHTVLIGGGPLDVALADAAAVAGVHVVATYGSAETAGGCVYDGVPLDGVGVALATDGRIRIAGPTLFSGYLGREDLTGEVLVDGWFLTADAGRIDEDGRLVVIGRLDDMIVSGGLNIPGPAVAERLREHPRLSAAEVLGVVDPEWGNRVVAFVVPVSPEVDLVTAVDGLLDPRAQDSPEVDLVTAVDGLLDPRAQDSPEVDLVTAVDGLLDPRVQDSPEVEEVAQRPSRDPGGRNDLRDWIAQVHPRSWAPRQVVVLDAIPQLPNGKPDRQALRALAEQQR